MGYVRQVALTVVVRVALIPVGLLGSVLTARWLGPEALGIYAAIGTILLTAGQLAGLGLPTAVMREAAARPASAGRLLANARLTGAVTGLAAIAALALLAAAAPRALGPVPPGLLGLAAAALPFTFASAQFQAVVLGLKRARHYNLVEAWNRIGLLAAVLIAVGWLRTGVRGLVAATVALAVVQLALFHGLLLPESRTWRPDPALLRRLAGTSARAYLTILLTFLVLRSDLLLISVLLGATATGLYSVAVQGADALLILPAVSALLLFPRVAEREDAASVPLTALVSRHTAFLIFGACAVTAAVAPWVVPALFGSAYAGAVRPLLILLPGVFFVSLQLVVQNDLAGRDYPWILPATWSLVLALNVGLNLLLLGRFGIAAAAFSSTVAYAAAFAIVARYWLRRFPEARARDLLLLSGAELRGLVSRIHVAAGSRGAPR